MVEPRGVWRSLQIHKVQREFVGMGSGGTKCTRNFLTFANTTAIAYRQNLEAPVNFWRYAIAVVFANVRKLRVRHGGTNKLPQHTSGLFGTPTFLGQHLTNCGFSRLTL